MDFIIVIISCVVVLVILWFVLEIHPKQIKKMGENKELNELTNTFPENIEICKSILKKLGNEKVKIKEEKESKTSLYIVITNTIAIANIRDSFARIQTIAHECIHSTQSKKMLWFNFIFTNIYMIYFILISILTLCKIINFSTTCLYILILMSIVQYLIRSMLETDAMTRAKYVAKEYLEENNICKSDEIEKLVIAYDKLNKPGIKLINYVLFAKNVTKIIIYCVICCIV